MPVLDREVQALLDKRKALLAQLAKQDELKKNLEAIERVLTSVYKVSLSKSLNGSASASGGTVVETRNLAIPKAYTSTLTWDEKVLYALAQIKAGFVPVVAKKLHEIDPTISMEVAEKKAKFGLSTLYRQGIIRVVTKQGRRYKYGIKED
jgi:hypothetical protein